MLNCLLSHSKFVDALIDFPKLAVAAVQGERLQPVYMS